MITFIILGATGDLTKRKIIPAIYRLLRDKKISNFSLIAVSRTEISPRELINKSKPFIKGHALLWKMIENNTSFHQLDFNHNEAYLSLGNKLRDDSEKIFYLATGPEFFDKITHNLARLKLVDARSKVVYEKPFGEDLPTARQLNKCIKRVFSEKRSYRIDHYLGKELVGAISIMRFSNRILEPLWSRKHIASVEIQMSEKIDVAGRGSFYDQYGVLKDVVQNHALQLLALTAMEAPKHLTGDDIRNKKAKVLKQVRVKKYILGQYQGYLQEKGIAANSQTETFAKIQLGIRNFRWWGVPFYITAGKALSKKETKIKINFKQVKCLLDVCPSVPNSFTIRVQPDEGFAIELNSKIPGNKHEILPVSMDFCEEAQFGPNTPGAYENLLEDVIKGDQSVFVRDDEIEAAWKIIDKMTKTQKSIHPYEKGSDGLRWEK